MSSVLTLLIAAVTALSISTAGQPAPLADQPAPLAALAAETALLEPLSEVIVEHFPIEDVTSQFRDDWRNTRSGGRRHEGTDIYAPKGTAVVAIAHGVVVSMHNGGKGGYMLRIRHSDAWETWYMHLDNDTPGTDDGSAGEHSAYPPDLAVGDVVYAGQLIAYVGDSGNAETGLAHLHFELHNGGRKENPYPQLTHAWDRYLRSLDVAGQIQ